MLPDLLAPNLKYIFCGTAAGTTSARQGFYYAKSTNKFWKTLFQIGLTPVLLAPSEYQKLLQYGIGLTDLVKTKAGMDSILNKKDFGEHGLTDKLLTYQPRVLCFNGKKAAVEFLGRKEIRFGLQPETVQATKIFVAPSTSGAGNGYWDINLWQQLKDLA